MCIGDAQVTSWHFSMAFFTALRLVVLLILIMCLLLCTPSYSPKLLVQLIHRVDACSSSRLGFVRPLRSVFSFRKVVSGDRARVPLEAGCRRGFMSVALWKA
jgi:hypothetical protein